MSRALFALAFAACAHPAPVEKSITVEKPKTALADGALPRSPDVARELMGTLVVSDAARLLKEIAPSGVPLDDDALKVQLGALIGLDATLARVLDLSRPFAIGVLNPTLLRHDRVRPFLVMVPIVSRDQLIAALESEHIAITREPWGLRVPSSQGELFVGFRPGFAVVAWRADLVDAAARVLEPRLRHLEAPIALEVSVENLFGAFRPQVSLLLYQLANVAAGGETQNPFAMRALKGLERYAESVSRLEVLCDLDSGGLTVSVRVDGKAEGAWAGLVHEQKPGPSWGVQFLPRDAVMAYVTRMSPTRQADDVETQLASFAEALPGRAPAPARVDRWRHALERATASTGGELAWAVWPGRAGGLGVGGAYKLSDPGGARAAVSSLYDEAGGQLAPLVMRALGLDAARFAKGARIKHQRVQLAGAEVDLVELAVEWPAASAAERRTFEAMFGTKLVMATAFLGEQAVFAFGADWRPRLTAMIGTVHGEKAASLGDEPEFAEALAYHDAGRVSLSYLSTGRMARFAAGLVAQAHELDGEQRAAVDTLLTQVGSGAIVTTTNASGRRWELTTHVPRNAIPGAARLNAALLRVALSPMLNPPTAPPLPLPPSQVTPSLPPPQAAPGPSL